MRANFRPGPLPFWTVPSDFSVYGLLANRATRKLESLGCRRPRFHTSPVRCFPITDVKVAYRKLYICPARLREFATAISSLDPAEQDAPELVAAEIHQGRWFSTASSVGPQN